MRGWLIAVALVLVPLACAPTIAPAPPPCTQIKRVIALRLKPNVMFLIDRSSSTPRLSELQNALQFFITKQPTFARYGLTVFPHDDVCGASDETDVLLHLPDAGLRDRDFELQPQSDEAVFRLGGLTTLGSSSLGDSLRFVGALPELNDGRRDSIIVVLTGGLPTCGPDGGLDDAVAAMNELSANRIHTMTIAFDPDLSDGGTTDAFNRLAIAGRFERVCPNGLDLECGTFPVDAGDDGGTDGGVDAGSGGVCDQATRRCQPAFFQAASGEDLETALVSSVSLSSVLGGFGPCSFVLDRLPADPSDVSVVVDGELLDRCDGGSTCDTWIYEQGGGFPEVTLMGMACQHLLDSSLDGPVTLAIRIDHCDGSAPPPH